MSDTIVICPRTGNRCTSSGCTATDACFLGDPMGGSMNPGRALFPQHYVPQERLAEVERAARAAERAEIARKLRDWKADTELFRDDWNRARALALGDAATYVEERAHADSGGER